MSQGPSYTKLGLMVLLIMVLIVLSSKLFTGPLGKNTNLISPNFVEAFNLTSTFNFVFKSETLSRLIQENLDGKNGEYSVYIEELSSGIDRSSDAEVYSLKAYDSFPAASLYKLYLLAAVLKEIENGGLKMEDTVTATKDHLQEVFGETDFGYEEAPEEIEYTVEEALTRVGRISDNFAAIMLAEKISWEKIQEMADSLGAKGTIIKTPIQTTAYDTGLFFKKLHQRQIVNAQVSDKIIEFLSLSQLNDRIPAKLPEEVRVVHKTGELARIRHDGGIVFLEVEGQAKPYIIVLMSKDLKDGDQGIETLAKVSKDVYEYFKNKRDKN